ncbi:unnamed protein product [Protopolystoma xenopodis]|uniref:Uncharacterized protein n=1 Tax=Protopolystoma xenopodis TaxID=117903 RepID=A0A3S5B210_9PLAT|nr:unnamed protein product [Protopolystoma xenopodis]
MVSLTEDVDYDAGEMSDKRRQADAGNRHVNPYATLP